MAVYERAYRSYEGPLTAPRFRFLVLVRYAYAEILQSKIASLFSMACLLPPAGAALLIYLHHNFAVLENFPINPGDLIPIDESFFLGLMAIQCFLLGFLLVVLIGPGLVAKDLANNALPLYLSRPFTRTEYVVGKAAVIAIVLSITTWIPGSLLFFFQASLEGWGWLTGNLRILAGIVVGASIWILVLALITLAISAHVKRKMLGQVFLFGVFFISAASPAWLQQVFPGDWSSILSIPMLMKTIWASIYGVQDAFTRLPAAAAWLSILVMCGASLAVLARKLKAYEVVR